MRLLSTLRSRTAAATTVALALGSVALVPAGAVSPAVTLNVTTTADIAANAGACGSSSVTVPSPLSLREATCIADNYGAQTVTINVPAGTFTLANGELKLGTVSGSSISIVGAGSGSTVIDGGAKARVLNLDPNVTGGMTTSISGVTVRNGIDSADQLYAGAGILAGDGGVGAGDRLTVTGSTITANTGNPQSNAPAGSVGGALAMDGGTLTITNSVISGNSGRNQLSSGLYYASERASDALTLGTSTVSANTSTNTVAGSTVGGAVSTVAYPGSTVTVTGTRFVGNSAAGAPGNVAGAAINAQGGSLNVGGSTFTGNSATTTSGTAQGGAVYSAVTAPVLHYNRITGNTAASGSGLVQTTGTANAAENWWGCNGGPGAAGCDSVAGGVTASPRLVLGASASPSTLTGPNATSTITASLLTDSAGVAVSPSALASAFDGLPVTFSDPPGDATVGGSAGPKTANLSGGTAAVGYQSNTTTGLTNDTVALDNASVQAPIEVDRAPAVTSPNAAAFRFNQTGSFTVTTTGYPTAAVTESGALPAGLTFVDNGNGTATLSGTPTGAGTFALTITAANGIAPNATQTLTVTVGQAPAFTSASTATFTVGQAGSVTVTTSGTPTVSTVTESGTLPAGLTFTDNGNGTATIAGTPTGTGNTYPLTLTATNGVAPDATQNLTLQVNQAPSVVAGPPNQVVQPGMSVSFSASGTGVPTPSVQWQRSTDGGASFTNIAGATSTTYTFTATAGDNGNQYRAVFTNVAGTATSSAGTLYVRTAPAFTSADHATFTVGRAGSFAITTTGLPSATLGHSGAQFPSWLTLTDNGDGTGTLTGTPPAGSGGAYAFTLQAANGVAPSASQNFTLFVDDSPVITSADHATFTVGQAGSFAVTTVPGYPTTTAITLTGTLPAGVTFTDHGDGTAVLSGTPAGGTGGSYPLTISASASGGQASAATQSFTLTVLQAPRITSSNHATFSVGSAGSFTVTTSAGNPTATTLTETGTLPAGVSFTDHGDGTATIAGTPNVGAGGVYTVGIVAANGVTPDATQTFTLTVNEPTHITSVDHVTFGRGVADAFTVTTAGGQPSSVTLTETGTLPAGVTFTDNGDGTATLGGTATQTGVFTLGLRASNGVQPDGTQSFTLTVTAPPTITSSSVADFAVGSAGSFTVTTAPGFPAARTLTESGALPSGVTFTDNGDGTATLAGTPAAGTGGNYPLTLTAANTAGHTDQAFTLTVTEPASFTSADHATFAVGSTGSFTVTTAPGFPTARSLTESGALPSGVTFTDNLDGTATLAGTPAAGTGGSYPITLTASTTVDDTDQAFTLTVTELPTVTSADNTTFAVGSAGTFTVTTTAGYPAATTLTESGALPSGVTFTDNGDGTATLAGTPAAGTGGSYPLTLTAGNSAGHTDEAFTLTVTDVPGITSADHATFGVATAGTFTVTTSDGFPPGTTLSETGALPAGVTFTDNGDGTATLAGTPADGSAGTYDLTLRATNSAGHADQSFTLTVVRKAQTITVASTPPSPAYVGGSYPLSATSDSGLPVEYSVVTSPTDPACTLSGSTVGFVAAGSCLVQFDQAGDGTYAPAGQVTQQITVTTVPTSVAVTTAPAAPVYGQDVTATATVTADRGTPAGTVQFSVDGTAVGSPVTVAGGSATSPALTGPGGAALEPGARHVTAVFTPADGVTYAGGTGSADVTVGQAASHTALAVHAHDLTATVTAVAPGAGTPTGTVTFSVAGTQVGTGTLTNGVATLAYTVPAGRSNAVAAAYSGDAHFTASSASTQRSDPKIIARLSSASAKTRYGWYRTPVTVTFTCTTAGAPLTAKCPAPVTLHQGAAQSVTRTIAATDGGMATVVVRGINIDTTKPTVRITGPRNGATYAGSVPKARCVGSDRLSGIASCTLRTTTKGDRTTYTATATDRAGNSARTSVTVTVQSIYLSGASYVNGAFNVKVGHTYTLVVAGTGTRPVFYDAAVYPRRPVKRDNAFHAAGHHRWTLGVYMQRALSTHTYWNLGVKIGGTMHIVKIRVSK